MLAPLRPPDRERSPRGTAYAAAMDIDPEPRPSQTPRQGSRVAGRVQLVLLLLPVVFTAIIAGWQIAEHYL